MPVAIRIVSWNVGGHDIWSELLRSDFDVALLQEAKVGPSDWPQVIVPHLDEEWRTAGWTSGQWSRRTAVAQISGLVEVTPFPLTTTDALEPNAIPVSRPGTLTAATVKAGDESFMVVSVYGMWERAADGRSLIYADASAHRLLSDLASIVTTESKHRLIVAGDFNILHGYGEDGQHYWKARYSTVFDRAESMGLCFVGPQAPDGRQADPAPSELPEGSNDVPTYFTARQGPMSATRQLDFVFASPSLRDRLVVTALNRTAEEWGPSDHCRISIELAT